MYSHGSSARVGVGKRGHGGRNYRPPKEKKDPSKLVPPPLKECNCMIQLDVPEYAELAPVVERADRTRTTQREEQQQEEQEQQSPQRRRLHRCFAGRTLKERQASLRSTEQGLRSGFGVHLVVPGRNQTGPLAVVGKSYRETLPAVEYLMHRLVLASEEETEAPFLRGRIQRNVKDPNDVLLSGRFLQHQQQTQQHAEENTTSYYYLQPYWLFESDSWNTLVCPLTIQALPSANTAEAAQVQQTSIAEALQISLDNLRFELGNSALSELDVFWHPAPNPKNAAAVAAAPQKAFCAGDPSSQGIAALYRAIRTTKVVLPPEAAAAASPSKT